MGFINQQTSQRGAQPCYEIGNENTGDLGSCRIRIQLPISIAIRGRLQPWIPTMEEFDSEFLGLPEPNLVIAHDFPDRAMVSPIDTIHPHGWWLSNKPDKILTPIQKKIQDSMIFFYKIAL